MAKTLTCACGQVLDVADFAPGDQVQCPGCQAVVTVPGEAPQEAQEPVVAMATAVDDEDEARGQAGGTGAVMQQYLNPLERRRRVQRRADYAAQSKLKRIMIWPCLLLGLASLAVAGMGFYWAFLVEPKIEITDGDDGLAHLYARVAKEDNPQEYEKIEVRPDLVPGDKVVYDADDNPVITLKGEKLHYQGGILYAFLGDKLVPVRQSGFWFYEIDPATKKAVRRLDLPLVVQEKATMRYMPVDLKGTDFYRKGTSSLVDAAFYRAEEQFATTPLGKFKVSKPPLGIQPVFFIFPGLLFGVILLLAGGFFAYESYFSKSAKAAAEKRRADEAAQAAQGEAANQGAGGQTPQ